MYGNKTNLPPTHSPTVNPITSLSRVQVATAHEDPPVEPEPLVTRVPVVIRETRDPGVIEGPTATPEAGVPREI